MTEYTKLQNPTLIAYITVARVAFSSLMKIINADHIQTSSHIISRERIDYIEDEETSFNFLINLKHFSSNLFAAAALGNEMKFSGREGRIIRAFLRLSESFFFFEFSIFQTISMTTDDDDSSSLRFYFIPFHFYLWTKNEPFSYLSRCWDFIFKSSEGRDPKTEEKRNVFCVHSRRH